MSDSAVPTCVAPDEMSQARGCCAGLARRKSKSLIAEREMTAGGLGSRALDVALGEEVALRGALELAKSSQVSSKRGRKNGALHPRVQAARRTP